MYQQSDSKTPYLMLSLQKNHTNNHTSIAEGRGRKVAER